MGAPLAVLAFYGEKLCLTGLALAEVPVQADVCN